MRFILGVALVLSVLACSAVAQQAAPADNGPTLAVTLKFIQEKVNAQGVVTEYTGLPLTTGVLRNEIRVTLSWDSDSCRMSFTTHAERYHGADGVMGPGPEKPDVHDATGSFQLGQIADVMIKDFQPLQATDENRRFPVKQLSLMPISANNNNFLFGSWPEGKSPILNFTDSQIAQRVANAFKYASELCKSKVEKESF